MWDFCSKVWQTLRGYHLDVLTDEVWVQRLYELRSKGYYKGGTVGSALIGYGDRWYENALVRYIDSEPARHKVLDLVVCLTPWVYRRTYNCAPWVGTLIWENECALLGLGRGSGWVRWKGVGPG